MALQGIQWIKWDKLLTFVPWTANSEVFPSVCAVPVSLTVVLSSITDPAVGSPLILFHTNGHSNLPGRLCFQQESRLRQQKVSCGRCSTFERRI